MATIADLWVGLGIRADGFNKGLSQAESRLDSFSSKVAATGARMANLGKTMSLGLTAPIVAGAAFAIDAASDLAEATTAATAVYGDSAKQIIANSKDTNQALLVSQQQYLESATVFGVYGQAAGLAGQDLVDFGAQGLTAAQDLSSFYNIPLEEALAAWQSGLRGETEPMSAFGISMQQAELEAYALTEGLWDGTSAMTAQQKTLIRQAYMLDHMGAAQGDAAKTAGGLANQQRILQKRFRDISATIGTQLLPLALAIATAIGNFFTRLENLNPAIIKWGLVLAGVVAAIGPLLMVLGYLMMAFSALLGPIGLVIAAIALLALAWQNDFLGIASRTTEFISDIIDVFQRLRGEGVDPISAAIRAFGSALEDLTGIEMSAFFFNLAEAVQAAIFAIQVAWAWWRDSAVPAIAAFAQAAWDWITGTAIPAIQAIAGAVAEVLGPFVSWLWNTGIPAVMSFAQTVWSWLTNTAIPGIAAVATAVADFLAPFVSWLLDTAIPAVQSFAQTIWSWITSTAVPAFEAILTAAQTYIEPIINWLHDTAGPEFQEWAGEVQEAGVNIRNALSDIWRIAGPRVEAIYDFFAVDLIPAVSGWVQTIQQAGVDIRTAFSDIWAFAGDALTSAKDIWGDIQSAIETFAGAVKGLVQPIIDAFQSVGDAIPDMPDWVPGFGDKKDAIQAGGAAEGGGGASGGGKSGLFGGKGLSAAMRLAAPDFSDFLRAHDTAFAAAQEKFTAYAAAATVAGQNAGQGFANTFAPALNEAVSHAGAVQQSLESIFSGIAASATNLGMAAGQGFNTGIVSGTSQAVANAGSAANALRGIFSGAAADMTNLGRAGGQGFASGVAGGMAQAVGAAASGAGQIRGVLQFNLSGQGFAIGASLGQGIASGIASMVGAVAAQAAAIVGAAVSAARGAGGIASPSKVMAAEIGLPLAQGVALGITRGVREVEHAMGALIAPPRLSPYDGAGTAGRGGDTYIINAEFGTEADWDRHFANKRTQSLLAETRR